jgi:hypothetical protein
MGNNVGGPKWASQRDMEIAGAYMAQQQGPQTPPPPDPAEPARRRRNAVILTVIGLAFFGGGVADLLGAQAPGVGMAPFAFAIIFAVLARSQLRRGAQAASRLQATATARS